MNYKDTLLLPKTGFPMRGNLAKNEPKYVERWKEQRTYYKVVEQNKGHDDYLFHDGPPYANGNMHIGHMLNKIIKDVITRYKNMRGYYAPYIPGWDTHGLPIENEIRKTGVDRKTMTTAEFREKCRVYALEQVEKQKEQCFRVGTFADYDDPYLTLTPDFEANQIDVFAKMAMDGLIYKGKKPVYWSYSSESALAEAEIEYKDIKSPAIYIKFKVRDGKGILDEDTYFAVWTTTPWTIPADNALCLNANLVYVLVDTEAGKLIMSETLMDSLCDTLNLEKHEVLAKYKGSELEYITVDHPFKGVDPYYDRPSLVILGNHVTDESGTGVVHTAGGHGVDDFNVTMEYGLDLYCPVDDLGFMMEETGEFLAGHHTMEDTYDENGNKIDSANKVVTLKLDELGLLLKLEWITHSYPHDWRTKKPVIFRATAQWFCSIDKIRDKLLDEIDKVEWINEWGHIRIYNMIKDRGDWCISRQRSWGVPIPIIYCEDGTPIMEKEVFERISALFREYGSNVWFEKDEKFLLPEGYTNEHSPNGIFKKEKDIMDVWFDSGSSHTGCMRERGYRYPVDLYFEGSDQYRGWFNSSLIVGTAVYGQAPYKTVLSHGFVLDANGNKMSKSQGNAVDPVKVINKYGADILRLWATSVAYQSDVRIGDEIMKGISENYRKIRNTMRFVLGNLNDFSEKDLVPVNELAGVDKYMLITLNELMDTYENAMDRFEFGEANQAILNYFTNLLSAFYMDFTKDILYTEEADSLRRRQVQTVLYYNAKVMMKLLSPILVFTMEELHDYFDCDEHKEESVFLEPYPDRLDIDDAENIKDYYKRFWAFRKDVLKAAEELRANKIIKSNMEVKLTIALKDDYADLKKVESQLGQLLIVAKVELVDSSEGLAEYDSAYIKAEKFNGVQCPRCWNYFYEDEMQGELCPRCSKVLKK